jgi:Tol biopolymer transport system component
VPVLQTPSDEVDGQFSPDGKWIAYSSNVSGRYEIYVMSFSRNSAATAGRWQMSNRGGRAPRWRGDGQELYYLTTDENKLMAVTIRKVGGSLQAETPYALFSTLAPSDSGDNPFPYDVTADGRRFLIEETPGTEASVPLVAILNWQAALKK